MSKMALHSTSNCLIAGTPNSKAMQSPPNDKTVVLAVSAVDAWGCFVELLGEAFLIRDPPVGQPMLKVGLWLKDCRLQSMACLHSTNVCAFTNGLAYQFRSSQHTPTVTGTISEYLRLNCLRLLMTVLGQLLGFIKNLQVAPLAM